MQLQLFLYYTLSLASVIVAEIDPVKRENAIGTEEQIGLSSAFNRKTNLRHGRGGFMSIELIERMCEEDCTSRRDSESYECNQNCINRRLRNMVKEIYDAKS